MSHKCTLSSLYKDFDIRFIVYEKLTEVFEVMFEQLLKDAVKLVPYLTCPARFFEKDIKKLFIEEGLVLNTIIDLEKVLNQLNYLNFERFKKQKKSFEDKK